MLIGDKVSTRGGGNYFAVIADAFALLHWTLSLHRFSLYAPIGATG